MSDKNRKNEIKNFFEEFPDVGTEHGTTFSISFKDGPKDYLIFEELIFEISNSEFKETIFQALYLQTPTEIVEAIFEEYIDENLTTHLVAKLKGISVSDQIWHERIEFNKLSLPVELREFLMNIAHNICANYLETIRFAVDLNQLDPKEYHKTDRAITALKRRILSAIKVFSKEIGADEPKIDNVVDILASIKNIVDRDSYADQPPSNFGIPNGFKKPDDNIH